MKVPSAVRGTGSVKRVSIRVLTFLAGVLTGQELLVPGLVRLVLDLIF